MASAFVASTTCADARLSTVAGGLTYRDGKLRSGPIQAHQLRSIPLTNPSFQSTQILRHVAVSRQLSKRLGFFGPDPEVGGAFTLGGNPHKWVRGAAVSGEPTSRRSYESTALDGARGLAAKKRNSIKGKVGKVALSQMERSEIASKVVNQPLGAPFQPSQGAVHTADRRRDLRGVNVPDWADPGEPTSTLGIPSRTTFASAKLPTSAWALGEMMTSAGARDLVSTPRGAAQALYAAARTAFFFGQTALVGQVLGGGFLGLPHGEDLPPGTADEVYRVVTGGIVELIKMDGENVRRGIYRAPYDMDPRHRQWSPAFWIDRHEKLLQDRRTSRDMRRRNRRL
ncbi:hypothetical protein KFL_003340050 [Klebsormidium nitens]|uniref:Uncharacterized protein n=1 Tax=Klebsormidium nitens TaxID=105231 RepID=A0A1Y1IDG3_KLENI|nr:hypothetical protein KFL_003340050 [Klebsormidium nitens]|eukprot:GAQ87141.1 hypothetical protein KFL_003340050 [Klebsormidium nitens]